jgi:gamma-glutamylcyclotransferase (GGCT)/AIG2-like uncharacterized protein YtfP
LCVYDFLSGFAVNSGKYNLQRLSTVNEEVSQYYVLREDLQMKKIFILMLAVIMSASMAACGVGDVGGTAPTSSQAESKAPVSSAAVKKEYDNNFSGLLKYLSDNKIIEGNGLEMKSDYIGAKKGVKYQFSYNGNANVTVELYEYDLENLNAKAKSVIDEIKEKETFTVLDNTFPAVMSDNGRYMMVYRDTVTKDQNIKHHQEATKLFKEFKK